jgi:hypothetical protein
MGCRNFRGVGASLAYHFGEKTTSLVRGPKNRRVKKARIRFLQKWGILPSTFVRFFLRAGSPAESELGDPTLDQFSWERMRLGLLKRIYDLPQRRAA